MARVCVATTSRSDYGLLRHVMREVSLRPSLDLQILATGTHFSALHGHSIDEIARDGLSPTWKHPSAPSTSSPEAVTEAFGETATGVGRGLAQLQPDMMIVLGDRYETLAAGVAATLAGVTLAHLHGGELTHGAVDDCFRHALTKLSDVHFVAAEPFRQRVIQLGESPERVHVVGALGLDSIAEVPEQPSAILSALRWWHSTGPRLLVTLHPETRSPQGTEQLMSEVVDALRQLPHCSILITGPNADASADTIRSRMQEFAHMHESAEYVASLGHLNYLHALRHCTVVVGNSSSGIIEAPTIGVPTVNIGDRQAGRPLATSVLNARPVSASITKAILHALTPGFQDTAQATLNPYGTPGASRRVVDLIEIALEGPALPSKVFVDLLQEPTRF